MTDIKFPSKVIHILEKLNKNGYQAYVVGGAIRDSLLMRNPKDWDIATNAIPDVVENMFNKTIPTGKQYGTISINLDGDIFEVTTYRLETDYDGRRPNVVEFSTNFMDDLKRRDFTINAMAMGMDGVLIDPFNGKEHLELGLIECVGNAHDRIEEDKLRALRAVRFASRYDFTISEDILEEIILVDIKQLSSERIRDEFNKIIMSEFPYRWIKFLLEIGLFTKIFPNKNRATVRMDSNNSTWKGLSKINGGLTGRLAVFFGDVYYCTDDIATIMKSLKYSNNEIADVVRILDHCNDVLDTHSDFKNFIVNVGEENLDKVFDFKLTNNIIRGSKKSVWKACFGALECNKIIESGCALRIGDLALDGRDLLSLGYEGEAIGKALNVLLKHVWKYPMCNTPETLKSVLEKENCNEK